MSPVIAFLLGLLLGLFVSIVAVTYAISSLMTEGKYGNNLD